MKNLIIRNLNNWNNFTKNKYKNLLLIYIKNPLIEKYAKKVKDISDDLIKSIKKYQQNVSSQIKEIKTIDTEEDLVEINEIIDSTLVQINNYKL